jgi:hypothetical protein
VATARASSAAPCLVPFIFQLPMTYRVLDMVCALALLPINRPASRPGGAIASMKPPRAQSPRFARGCRSASASV